MSSSTWKHPDELIRLQRLKQKKSKLAARLNGEQNKRLEGSEKAQLLEAKIAQKRKNPFAIPAEQAKRPKAGDAAISNDQDDSLLGFISHKPTSSSITTKAANFIRETPPPRAPVPHLVLKPFDPAAFSKLLHSSTAAAVADDDDAQDIAQKFSQHLPMDWCLKTRVRFFCSTELPATTLKASQMASSLTSFVRCLDTQNSSGSNSSLDISPATRFNQATHYWQHPHLPWLTLFPRNSKNNSGITVDERQRKALAEDWEHSFRGLFQLLRARQCPYFYLCANLFTVLFRAAGTAGRVEIHALITPTTRGLRQALRDEGIEFSMPLKKETCGGSGKEGSFAEESKSSSCDKDDSNASERAGGDTASAKNADDDDDLEEEEWLESLGVDEKEIRKIRAAHTRQVKAQEMAEDFSDNSLLLIEGVECQSFFSFLLDAKSTTTNVGRLAGVPPTLLAPVAFPKATMQSALSRSSKVRMDGVDYCSIEVKGLIMPTFLPYICQLLRETKPTFSATLASSMNTLAFSKATQKLLEGPRRRENNESDGVEDTSNAAGQVFGKENLSDCGLHEEVIETMCRVGPDSASLLENVCYDKDHGYAWS